MAIIAITTSSSMRVNAVRERLTGSGNPRNLFFDAPQVARYLFPPVVTAVSISRHDAASRHDAGRSCPNFGARHLCRFTIQSNQGVEAGYSPRCTAKGDTTFWNNHLTSLRRS